MASSSGLRTAVLGVRSDHVPSVPQVVRYCSRLQHRRVEQHVYALVARLRSNVSHAVQSLEQALDALLAAATGELLITAYLERHGRKHEELPFYSTLGSISG